MTLATRVALVGFGGVIGIIAFLLPWVGVDFETYNLYWGYGSIPDVSSVTGLDYLVLGDGWHQIVYLLAMVGAVGVAWYGYSENTPTPIRVLGGFAKLLGVAEGVWATVELTSNDIGGILDSATMYSFSPGLRVGWWLALLAVVLLGVGTFWPNVRDVAAMTGIPMDLPYPHGGPH